VKKAAPALAAKKRAVGRKGDAEEGPEDLNEERSEEAGQKTVTSIQERATAKTVRDSRCKELRIHEKVEKLTAEAEKETEQEYLGAHVRRESKERSERSRAHKGSAAADPYW